jgi:hypothetical protein
LVVTDVSGQPVSLIFKGQADWKEKYFSLLNTSLRWSKKTENVMVVHHMFVYPSNCSAVVEMSMVACLTARVMDNTGSTRADRICTTAEA